MKRFLAVLGCGVLLALPGCADPVTLENFHKIQPGMTQQEVESILGGRKPESYETLKTWRSGNERRITIEFDDRGRVVNKTHDGLK